MRRRDLVLSALGAALGVFPRLTPQASELQSASNWMHENLGSLGRLQLRQLCMPGSHDAGMSCFVDSTRLASACNTVTQYHALRQQLEFGVRYFDIRPVLRNGRFMTGHYGYINLLGSWQGGVGQSIESVIDEVNAFTRDHPELVILNLSHDLDTDRSRYAPLDQAQWDALLQSMTRLRGLFRLFPQLDLGAMSLTDCIGSGGPAVLVRVSSPHVNLDHWLAHGFLTSSMLPITDSYSNTTDLEKMAADQLDKMRRHAQAADGSLFLLSWTLTLGAKDATLCPTGFGWNILDLAEGAKAALGDRLLQALSID